MNQNAQAAGSSAMKQSSGWALASPKRARIRAEVDFDDDGGDAGQRRKITTDTKKKRDGTAENDKCEAKLWPIWKKGYVQYHAILSVSTFYWSVACF
jgi:hypothetical protein